MEPTAKKVISLVEMVCNEELLLPEIQRGYVWNRPQIRDLIESLYHDYPAGAIMLWETDASPISKALGAKVSRSANSDGKVHFVLDGQQRLTSLKLVFEGKDFKGKDLDIRFNYETEEFQLVNRAIRSDKRWVPVTDVLCRGAVEVCQQIGLLNSPNTAQILNRLNRLERIKDYLFPVYPLRGYTYEQVTEIFVRVNSKGTRLRQAELAIARLAFRLPGVVSEEFGEFEDELEEDGFDLGLPFLVRCMTAVATQQSQFPKLREVSETDIKKAWAKTREGLEYFINLIRENLGIESSEWLSSANALIVPTAYLAKTSVKHVEKNKLLQWFLLASIWGRYSGSAETRLDKDLKGLGEKEPFAVLMDNIKQEVGRLEVTADDLDDANINSPLFIAAYLSCRNRKAEDWFTGVRLTSTGLGSAHSLEIHHIFPKALLKNDYKKRDINEIANLAFLSTKANRSISKTEPATYLEDIAKRDSSLLERQHVPMDRSLWTLDRFEDFLTERRGLLARGINDYVMSLT